MTVSKYDDIMGLSRPPILRGHPPLEMARRAAQFAPFKTITKFHDSAEALEGEVVFEETEVVVEEAGAVFEEAEVVFSEAEVVFDEVGVALEEPEVMSEEVGTIFEEPGVVLEEPEAMFEEGQAEAPEELWGETLVQERGL